MIFIYILLGIIAVGVLLISEEGKGILNGIFKLTLVAGFLYLGFLIVLFVIAFFSSGSFSAIAQNVKNIIGVILTIILIFAIAGILLAIWKNRKQIPRKIKAGFENFGRYAWDSHRVATIFLIIFFSFIFVLTLLSVLGLIQ